MNFIKHNTKSKLTSGINSKRIFLLPYSFAESSNSCRLEMSKQIIVAVQVTKGEMDNFLGLLSLQVITMDKSADIKLQKGFYIGYNILRQ